MLTFWRQPGSKVFLPERHHRGTCACHYCGPFIVRQPLAISQVMRMTLVALMILVTTMPRLLIVITIGLVSFSFR